jgi:site-specific DNA recombinase
MRSERGKTTLRCAVYTRVSTEHGLDQEFNSLDNQREASEAYVPRRYQSGEVDYVGGISKGATDRRLRRQRRARSIDGRL